MEEYKVDQMYQELGLSGEVIAYGRQVEDGLAERFRAIDETAEYNQIKVLRAMQKHRVSAEHFAASTGYGYNDSGRETLEAVYAETFHAEAALVRSQIICGTQALYLALSANLLPGDELLSPVGKPYDTLEEVIGIRPSAGSLAEYGVTYASRPTLSVARIGELIAFLKQCKPDIICMVDNCYGEFVEEVEPTDVGADLIVGSLIKNPGGGLAPCGGYIAGREDLVERCARRLSSPGLGKEVGANLGVNRDLYQGFFLAPTITAGALKGAIFAANLYERLGYPVLPNGSESRHDIIQAVELKSPEALCAFCEGIQEAAPVDSYVTPVPWDMPGYDSPVIMAAGAFVQGSSIELSADGPLKPPYTVFFQGGLTWYHAKTGILKSLQKLVERGITKLP